MLTPCQGEGDGNTVSISGLFNLKLPMDKFGKKGFFYGGHKFVRRSAGSGNLKQNTVTFVKESIEKKLMKKIRVGFQIDIETGNVIARYKSMSAAARSVGGNFQNIDKAAKGIYKQAYGYKWRFDSAN